MLHFFPHGHCNVRGIEIVLFSVAGIEIAQRLQTLKLQKYACSLEVPKKKDEFIALQKLGASLQSYAILGFYYCLTKSNAHTARH